MSGSDDNGLLIQTDNYNKGQQMTDYRTFSAIFNQSFKVNGHIKLIAYFNHFNYMGPLTELVNLTAYVVA